MVKGIPPISLFLATLLLAATSVAGQETPGLWHEPYREGPQLGSSPAPGPLFGTGVNPAAAGLVEGPQAGLFWSRSAMGGALATRLLGPFSLGVNGAYLPLEGTENSFRFGLDVGLDLGRVLKAGFAWQRTFGDGDIGGLDPMSLGLLVRPHRFLSLAVTAFNVSEEPFAAGRYGSGSDLVRLGGGIAVRPGTGKVRLDGSVDVDRKGRRWESQVGIVGTLYPGLEVGISGHHRRVDHEDVFGVGATLQLATAYTTFAGGYRFLADRSDYFGAVTFSRVSESTRLVAGKVFVAFDLPVAFGEGRTASLFGPAAESLLDFRLRLRQLALDPEVTGVFLTVRQMATGWAQAQELAATLQLLRDHSKTVVVYLLGSANQAYYLAAHADHIVINPAASIFLTGIYSRLDFYARTLEKIGIQGQFVRIGAFKSYPEKFQGTEPSPEYRATQNAMLDRFYGQLVRGIATARKVAPKLVEEWIDQGPYTANQALSAGLVDKVASRTDVKDLLAQLGYPGVRLSGGYPVRDIRDRAWGPQPRIAVLTVQGSMVDGRGFSVPMLGRFVGSDAIIGALKTIRRDRSLAGLLVRIDSPGGSALAAERMHAELSAVAKEIPVVVSMGNVAASGGYYLAVAAPRIFASSGTVTGSIGIWFGKVVASGLLDLLAVDRTIFQRGKNAGLLDLDRTLSDPELASLAGRLKEMYDLFVLRVSTGRGLSTEAVDQVAQGRVWTGADALGHKLVDVDGGVLEALDALKGQVGLSVDRPVTLVYYPQLTFAQQVTRTFTGGSLQQGEEFLGNLRALVLNLQSTQLWAVSPLAWVGAP